MQIVANIFLSMLPYLAMAIPLIALVRSMILRQFGIRGIHTTVVREVLVWIFILYIVGIASQTILPEVALSSEGISLSGYGYRSVNFELFRILQLVKFGGDYALIRYFLCNILMMVPISFFSDLLYHKAKWYRGILIGVCSSIFIEWIQLFVGRCFDVDDMMMNTFGAVIGTLLYLLIAHAFPAAVKKCRVSYEIRGEE